MQWRQRRVRRPRSAAATCPPPWFPGSGASHLRGEEDDGVAPSPARRRPTATLRRHPPFRTPPAEEANNAAAPGADELASRFSVLIGEENGLSVASLRRTSNLTRSGAATECFFHRFVLRLPLAPASLHRGVHVGGVPARAEGADADETTRAVVAAVRLMRSSPRLPAAYLAGDRS